jgi:hypothetical protein
MQTEIKSGKQIVESFFATIEQLPNIQKDIATLFTRLYSEGKLTDTNVKNGLQKIREKNVTKD